MLVLVLVAILTYSSLVYFAETHSYSTQEVEGVNCTGWVKDLRRKTWRDSINSPCYRWTRCAMSVPSQVGPDDYHHCCL